MNELHSNNDIFFDKADFYLKKIEANYEDDFLKRIKYDQLLIMSELLVDYKPKSRVIEEKKIFLDYIQYISKNDISRYSLKEIYKLENKYILKIVNRMPKEGYRIKNAWVMAYGFFILPIELILYFTGISNLYFNIPIPTILFITSQIKKDIVARKEGKLW